LHVPDICRDCGRRAEVDAVSVLPAGRREQVVAWSPTVPGIAEVLHARFVDHVYPAHTHSTWTLLIVDDGAIRFDLERHEHGAVEPGVTLLPPHVAHTGRASTHTGFRKRVLYLDFSVLDEALTGPAVATPTVADPLLRHRVGQLHSSLGSAGSELEAESRLVLIRERLYEHLRPQPARTAPARRRVADDLRDLLDSRVASGLTLREASRILSTHPDHLVRAFSAAFGLPPHRYLTGRRVDAARRRLLLGEPAADVAVATGFHDQAHLTRHFSHLLGTTPARYAAAQRASGRTDSARGSSSRHRLTWGPRSSG
jgi:AraC-like DNA-binding protein